MFSIRTAVRSLKRCKYKSILSMFICAVATFLMNLYAANVQDSARMLQKLPEAMEVSAGISNLDGSLDQGLKIKEKLVNQLLESEYVKAPVITVQLMTGFGEFKEEDWVENLTMYARGSNDIRGIPGLNPEDIKLAEGADPDFLMSDRRECLVDETILKARGLQVGDTVTLTLYYYRFGDYHEIFVDPLDVCEYYIAGSMNVSGDTGDSSYKDMLLPLKAVQDSFARAGFPFYADSCRFEVKNPLELNAFKEQMHDFGLLPVAPSADFYFDGNALTVRDETFIKAAERIEESLTLLRGFFPCILVIVAAVGYLTAHLFVQSRRPEYALMRSLGVGRGRSFYIFFLEYLILALLGCALGSLCAAPLASGGWKTFSGVAVLFTCCYLLGMSAALLAMGRLSVMAVLTKND